MFALDPHYLNCTVYLYPSEKDAQEGTRVGGSGFIVSVQSRHPMRLFPHIVTNRHVVDGGNHFIRFNTKDGHTVVMQTKPDEWIISVDDDLALLGTDLPKNVEWVAIDTEIFLDESCVIEGWPVFPGDEVFFYGRFISHDGKQRNKPVMRFGNISMLPDANAPVDMGSHEQVAFLVECRSLSGFSGSPAFVKLAGTRLMHQSDDKQGWIPSTVRLLGVDCGHFPFWSNVLERRNLQAAAYSNMFVETNSGMAIIVPAWRLLRLINQEPLKSEREALERKLAEKSSATIS